MTHMVKVTQHLRITRHAVLAVEGADSMEDALNKVMDGDVALPSDDDDWTEVDASVVDENHEPYGS